MLIGHFAASGSGVLNVPSWALAYAVFAVSVIVVLISRTRHVPRPRTRAGTEPELGSVTGRGGIVPGVARVIAAVCLVVLVAFSWFGPTGITGNIAPLALVGVLWPLGGWIALVSGWCWEAVDPFMLFARRGDRRRHGRDLGPPRIPRWAPVPVFATWVVFWIAWIRGDEPRNLAIWLTLYVVGISIVAARGGSAALRAANPLPTALDFTAGIFRQRRAETRAADPSGRSRIALIAAMLMGALGANRASDAAWFTARFPNEEALTTTVATVAVFALLSALIACTWWGCGRVVDQVRSEHGTRRIAMALAPAAGGLLLAQGFPVGLVVAQNLAIVASDPLGRGWDVFGTVYWQVSPDPLSGFALGMIQTAAILMSSAGALIMVGRAATARAADGTTSAVARNRAWMAALPAMAFIGVGGVVWTLLLVGR